MRTEQDELVAKYGRMISSLAHRMIRNEEVAREAAQEVWMEVLISLPAFRSESGLSTWIYTIARRTIVRYAQKERVATLPELREFRGLPEVDYDGEEEQKLEWIKEKCDKCLTSMNHCLTTDARLVFTFRVTLELSYKQIAAIMEMEEATVRKISSRAIRKVSEFMRDTCSLYRPDGACKCRINKQVRSVNIDKQYAAMRRVIRLTDLYRRFEKELPRKNYWIKLLP
ncbi:MAG: sigma-70 family RNA polymerase sigma factor [Tannerellaceae bacterium]|nr:sigma-70 family RNA polymerase sigma factor [Tannerellaceae bacterium]